MCIRDRKYIEKSLEKINQQIEKLANTLERLKLTQYIQYMENKKKMLFNSLISGIARGIGFTIGFSILGAIIIVILQQLASSNIPVIGKFIADVMEAAKSFSK